MNKSRANIDCGVLPVHVASATLNGLIGVFSSLTVRMQDEALSRLLRISHMIQECQSANTTEETGGSATKCNGCE